MTEQLAHFTYDNIPALPEMVDTQPMQAQLSLPTPALPPGYAPQAGPNPENGIPIFSLQVRKLPDGSFVNVEIVDIITPGDTKSKPAHKVTDMHRQKYAYYYDIWKRGLQMAPSGTPLEMWPVLTPAHVHALKAANIFTVEQLRDVSDANLQHVPMGVTLRNQAKAWLELKVNADKVTQQAAENDALKAGQKVLEDEMASLRKQIQALTAVRVEATEEKRPTLGRK